MADIIIVGNGPAGISAALYAVRAGFEVLVIGRDNGALEKADKIENYYGFKDAVSGLLLVQDGIAQARRLGVQFSKEEVVSMGFDGGLTVKTKQEEYRAKSVILATGSSRAKPKIKKLTDFEGRGVGYCAICDAFFYRGKNVAVLGNGEFALNEVSELLPVANSVTLLSNGEPLLTAMPENVRIDTKKIERLDGEQVLSKVVFEDASELEIDGLFVAMGVASSSDLARKIGAEINGTKIVVDENMATNIPGLFAAGDCTGGMLQIAKAVYEGAQAGTSAIKYIRQNA